MNSNFRMSSPGAATSSSTGGGSGSSSTHSNGGGGNESFPPPAPSSGAATSSTYFSAAGPSGSSSSSSSVNHLQPPPSINPNGTRSRSASQPIRYIPGAAPPPLSPGSLGRSSGLLSSPGSSSSTIPGGAGGTTGVHKRSVSRSLSSNAINKVQSSSPGLSALLSGSGSGLGLGGGGGGGDPFLADAMMAGGSMNHQGSGVGRSKPKSPAGAGGRARSSSLVTVTEVGGDDEPEGMVDRLGQGNENAAWVNAPGSWLIHPVLILFAKVMIDAWPSMTQDLSWTIVNLGYVAVSYVMFHSVTGVPFESTINSGGAYDDLTLWEQIDSGAQYTPAKKWLTSVPIVLFLVSTHYTKYEPVLFALNFLATLFVVFPKLPALHRLRFHFLPKELTAEQLTAPTPTASRPPSPRLAAILESSRLK